MNGNKRKRIAGTVMAAAVIVIAIMWFLQKNGYLLPGWIEWESGTYTDETGQYEIVLSRKTVRVIFHKTVMGTSNVDSLSASPTDDPNGDFSDGNPIRDSLADEQVEALRAADRVEASPADDSAGVSSASDHVWTSPDGVKVQSVLCCDIDDDGTDDLLLLCWKKGRYGDSRPFWVERDESTWSQHLFVYTLADSAVRQKWMSSYMGQDVAKMKVTARKTGGKARTGREIVRRHLILTDPDGNMSSWAWDSWGFAKEDTEITFAAFGDNLIHEPIFRYGLERAGSFDFLYENLRDVIRESDVTVLNQETPLTDRPDRYDGYPRFGTPAEVGVAIADAGFDVVTCATNHALDQGVDGISFTKDFFDSRGVLCLGIQTEDETEYRPYRILTRGGAHFALFNYTYGLNQDFLPDEKSYMVHQLDDEDRIRAELKAAKTETDLVMVFVHWGTEYEEEPDESQKKWAKIFLECGVDVVIGTHPHALQPCEVMSDGAGHEMTVYYSLGNYVSAQKEQSCVKGGMAQFTVSLTPDGYKITDHALKPLAITRQEDGRYAVDFADPATAAEPNL